MTRKSAAGLNALIRRALASRMASPVPETAADPTALDSLRLMAETRAATAEIIAQEANAIRFKALLDAARDQTANRNIRSAEERFAAAKDEWETVRQGLPPEPDPYTEPAEAPSTSGLESVSGTVPATLQETDELTWRNWLLVGGLPAVALVAGVSIAIHLYSVGGVATVAAEQSAEPTVQAVDTSLRSEPIGPVPAVAKPATQTVPAPVVKAASKTKLPARVHPAAAAKKPKRQVEAQLPRTRSEPDELAAGERDRFESGWTHHPVE
jgi:hypothetical protein